MKKKENTFNPILKTIERLKNKDINFYNYFSYVDTHFLYTKEELYNCTISYKFNNFHSETCYFTFYLFNHDTKQEIEIGTIYTKDTTIHPDIKTNFYFTETAAKELYIFCVELDNLLNDIYFNKEV